MNGDVIRTITIRGQAEGLDKLTADINKLAAAEQNIAVVSEQSAKKVLSLEDAWKRQTLRLDEAARAQANIARETKVADAALREGLATQAQHAQRLEQINQRYATTASSAQNYGKALQQGTGEARLARHELINLSRQVQDVGVGLASGQSPFTVLVQQGTQIADVFATSTGTLRGFFSQAIGWAGRFFTSAGGIATAVTAVGAAAIYAASQFRTASTTVEQALEEQNRLLKEAKTLIDAKTSAEAKAFAQSKELTQFQIERSQRDLMGKLGTAQMGAADIARRLSTKPTQVAGEMGEAPTGVASLGPGYERLADAAQKLNNAMAAGLPGMAAFQEEVAKVGRAHPELAQTAEEMIKLAQQGIPLEQAALKLQAIDAALKGIATDAQLAAAGLGSIAQFNLSNLRAEQTAQATERIAQYTLQIANLYPGMTIEGAKQAHSAQLQANITQARTPHERNIAEAIAKQHQMLMAGMAPAEALKILAIERGVAEKDIEASIERQNAKATQRAIAGQATVKTIEDAEQTIRKIPGVIDQSAEAAGYLSDEVASVDNSTARAARSMVSFANSAHSAAGDFATMADIIEGRLSMLGPSQFRKGGYESTYDPLMQTLHRTVLEKMHGAENVEAVPFPGGGYRFQLKPEYQQSQFQSEFDDLNKNLKDLTGSTDSLNATMQDALSPYYSQDPRTTRLGFREGVTGNPDWMTGATNSNPLVAVLGAGATVPGMANGGSFTVGGGDSATDNRMAVFPVASGEQIIVNRNRKQVRGDQAVNIDNRIVIMGAVDEDALSKMKISRYQQAQRMRAGLRG